MDFAGSQNPLTNHRMLQFIYIYICAYVYYMNEALHGNEKRCLPDSRFPCVIYFYNTRVHVQHGRSTAANKRITIFGRKTHTFPMCYDDCRNSFVCFLFHHGPPTCMVPAGLYLLCRSYFIQQSPCVPAIFRSLTWPVTGFHGHHKSSSVTIDVSAVFVTVFQ